MPRQALLRLPMLILLASALPGCGRDEAGAGLDATPATTAGRDAAATARDLPAGAPRAGMSAPSPGRVVVDARPLAGQAELGIRSLLGNPTTCEDVSKGRRCSYAQNGTDVVFVDGMADWITVADLGHAPFSPAALARVGLPTNEDPIESTPELMRWQNIAGFREVTLYAGPAGQAGRIEMKMATL